MTKVRLVVAPQSLIPELGEEDLVPYMARVSNPSNQNNTGTSGKLMKYLIKNHHWSPLEMISLTMEIETTRDIARQILRHRSFSFQEFSQRYADPTGDLGFVTREARLQDFKNRQNSIEVSDEKLTEVWEAYQRNIIRYAQTTYDWAIKMGIAKEQARAILPEGMTVSRMYMAGTLRSWIHYCQLRMDKATQKEHREVATLCWNEIINRYPYLAEALQSDS